jgi:hypothetical protein
MELNNKKCPTPLGWVSYANSKFIDRVTTRKSSFGEYCNKI